jgi:hypothetical protein
VGKQRSSSSQTRGQRPTCPPLGRQRRRLARQPTRCRLLLGHGCPASSSCGEEGDGTGPDAALPPRGEDVVDSATGGGLTAAIIVVARRRKEYHVVAAVEGHELETLETEHRPGLERLLETTHLELDGKLFVNTQQAPTWHANCRRFDPGGSLDRRVNCRCVSQPIWVGARRNTRGKEKGNYGSCCPAPRADALAVGGYKRSRGMEREREPVCQPVLPRGHLLVRGPWTFLL